MCRLVAVWRYSSAGGVPVTGAFFGLRAWTARALRNLGGPGRPGAAIRRSDASTQFTKLRSGCTRPPLRALSKPTTPTATPMPASANAEAVCTYENTWSPAGRRQGPRDTNLPNLCTPGRTWLHVDEPALGRPGRCVRCAERVAGSNSHCKRQFTRAARRPQRPAFPMRRLRASTLWSP